MAIRQESHEERDGWTRLRPTSAHYTRTNNSEIFVSFVKEKVKRDSLKSVGFSFLLLLAARQLLFRLMCADGTTAVHPHFPFSCLLSFPFQ